MKDPQMASGRFQLGATLNQVVAVWKTGLGSAGSPRGPGPLSLGHLLQCWLFKHKKKGSKNAHFSAVVRDTLFVLWDGLILASWWLCGSWWELASFCNYRRIALEAAQGPPQGTQRKGQPVGLQVKQVGNKHLSLIFCLLPPSFYFAKVSGKEEKRIKQKSAQKRDFCIW